MCLPISEAIAGYVSNINEIKLLAGASFEGIFS
jgi:hypothetical protein